MLDSDAVNTWQVWQYAMTAVLLYTFVMPTVAAVLLFKARKSIAGDAEPTDLQLRELHYLM